MEPNKHLDWYSAYTQKMFLILSMVSSQVPNDVMMHEYKEIWYEIQCHMRKVTHLNFPQTSKCECKYVINNNNISYCFIFSFALKQMYQSGKQTNKIKQYYQTATSFLCINHPLPSTYWGWFRASRFVEHDLS